MTCQTWAWLETFKGNVNQTNPANVDAYWTSGGQKKGEAMSMKTAIIHEKLGEFESHIRSGANRTFNGIVPYTQKTKEFVAESFVMKIRAN